MFLKAGRLSSDASVRTFRFQLKRKVLTLNSHTMIFKIFTEHNVGTMYMGLLPY